MRLGADALAIGIPGGSSHQAAMLEMLSAVTEEAHTWGMPVIRHSYPSGELWGDREGSTESVMCTARAAAECGTDIVKTWYTGSAEEFRRIVEAAPTPVVAAGGASGIPEVVTLGEEGDRAPRVEVAHQAEGHIPFPVR